MKRFIPQMLRGPIRWAALLWATGMLAGISAHAADASADTAAASSNQLQSIDVQKLNANQRKMDLAISCIFAVTAVIQAWKVLHLPH